MKDIVKIFYDLETTGINYKKNSLHQLVGIIEINDKVVEKFDIRSRPHPKATIDPKALEKSGVTKNDIESYQDMKTAHGVFVDILSTYIDRYSTTQKAFLVGFNNRYFDDPFLRMWFELNNDPFIGSWFWNNTIDVLVLATEYLINRRPEMPSFQLRRAAIELGIDVDQKALHDAFYDVEITRKIYRIVTSREIEL